MSTVSSFERWWINAWPHRLHIRRYVPRFLKSCPEPFRGEVLEVGAGSGWTSRRILETFPQVELTATDLDPRTEQAYRRLQEDYGARLVVEMADMRRLPFDREQFDIVVALHVMHHVDDPLEVVKEFLRVARPGGLIGLADEDHRYVVGSLRWLWRSASRIGRKELEETLVEAGAELMKGSGDVHFIVWAKKPYPHGEKAVD